MLNDASRLFFPRRIMLICYTMYFSLIIGYWSGAIILLIEMGKGTIPSNALYVLLIIISMAFVPIIFLLILYPCYALAELCELRRRNLFEEEIKKKVFEELAKTLEEENAKDKNK